MNAETMRPKATSMRERLALFRSNYPCRELQIGQTRWEYISSDKKPESMLLLGGAMATADSSFNTFLRMEERYQMVSPSYPPVYTINEFIHGIAAILDHLNISSTHIMGHSLGAGIAHVFVRQFPERVDKLILDGFGLYTPIHTLFVKAFAKLPTNWLLAYYQRAIAHLLRGAQDGDTAFWASFMEELLNAPTTRERIKGQLGLLIDAFDKPDKYRIFQTYEKPGHVLLVLANDDRGFSQRERDILIASYPGAQIYTFQEGGHLSGYTHSEEFNALVDEFLIQNMV